MGDFKRVVNSSCIFSATFALHVLVVAVPVSQPSDGDIAGLRNLISVSYIPISV